MKIFVVFNEENSCNECEARSAERRRYCDFIYGKKGV